MFHFALRNLLSRRLRSILSVLGLTIAIAGMVGLFSVAGGIDRLVNQTFGRIPGLAVLEHGAAVPLFSNLPAEWGAELESIPGVGVVTPEVVLRVNLLDDERVVSPPRFLIGVDIPSRLKLRQPIFADMIREGRFLTHEDQGTTRVVISRQVAEEAGKKPGDTLAVNGVEMEIVGIFSGGSVIFDVNLLTDLSTVQTMLRSDGRTVSVFYVEPDEGTDAEELATRVERHFEGRQVARAPASLLEWGRGLLTGEPAVPAETSAGKARSAVEVRTQQDWADRFDEFSGDLNVFLTLLTTVGLLIAISSIINTMLMSVTERMVEFGILRANGWTRRDVMRLITVESGLLGLSGGVLGAITGWTATHIINAVYPDRIQLFAGPDLLAFSVAFSTLLGIVGGCIRRERRRANRPWMRSVASRSLADDAGGARIVPLHRRRSGC